MTRPHLTGRRFIAYFRVSTARQSLGLEAQQQAVEQFAQRESGRIVGRFEEKESGKRDDRPELAKAIAAAKVRGAVLLIAKLDRLSRDTAFIANLMKSGVKFVCADMPEATHLTIHVLAAVAQHEREAISQRTRAALAVVRERIKVTGQRAHPEVKRLGNPYGARALRRAPRDRANLSLALRRAADEFAESLRPVIDDYRAQGIRTLEALAAKLNDDGVETRSVRDEYARKKSRKPAEWYAATVANVLRRLEHRNDGQA